jgi:Dolichyl-phosphate-mannose-protein mannosyltransferase
MDLDAFLKKHHKLVFYGAWLAMNLIQAAATQLLDDEAYYWIYSIFPDWGYYDHPPMIALLIKAGTLLFPGELGVRFFIVIINIATLLVIQKLLSKKNPLLFYGILMSLGVAQIGGVIAVPDLPLMFFTAVFFLLYRRFLANMSLVNTLLLGINIAMMLYSKYHGVLIIFFTLLSNPKLFTRYQTYLAALIALVLFAPHLYWQYQHDFPSVQYHLVERNATEYRFTFTTEYILGQVLLVGPIMGWFFLWTAFKYRTVTLTERALHFSMIGFYVFFLISTFKGRVEPNWTVPVIVGLIVLSHQYMIERPTLQKWIFNTVLFSLAIVLVFRIYLVMDIQGPKWIKKDEFHHNAAWAQQVKLQSRGLPLVSISSYQQASKYWFYSGIQSYSLNTPDYRRNNFNYWPISDSLLGKTVYVLGRLGPVLYEKVPGRNHQVNGGAVIDSFFSFSKLQFENLKNIKAQDGTISLDCDVTIPDHYLDVFQQQPYNRATLQIGILNNDTVPDYYPAKMRVEEIRNTRSSIHLDFKVPIGRGNYFGRLATESRVKDQPTLNSATFSFEMK